MRRGGFLTPSEVSAIGFAAVGSNVKIDASALFYGAERITLGSDVRIDAFSVISAGAGGIRIGNHVHIASFGFLTGAASIDLKDFAGLSGRVSVYSSADDYHGHALTGPTIPAEFRRVESAPVVFEEHVVVGAGTIVLPGVRVGRGAAVGALSLLRKDVAEFTIVAGHSGRVIGTRKRTLLEAEAKLKAKVLGSG